LLRRRHNAVEYLRWHSPENIEGIAADDPSNRGSAIREERNRSCIALFAYAFCFGCSFHSCCLSFVPDRQLRATGRCHRELPKGRRAVPPSIQYVWKQEKT
jgi:hypothetical protein